MGWRDHSGGISDEATKDLNEKLAVFESTLDGLNDAITDANIAAASLKSWAQLSLKVVEVAEPILTEYLLNKKLNATASESVDAEDKASKNFSDWEEKIKTVKTVLSELSNLGIISG